MEQTITSRDNERVKHAVKLASSAAFRAQEGLLFAEGPRLCLDLAATLAPVRLFATAQTLAQWPALCGLAPETYTVGGHVAEKLSTTRSTQGAFGLFRLPAAGWEALHPEKGVLLCDTVQDPSNVGTMIRTAAGLGYGGVVLAGPCADPYSPKMLRAGMGAVGRVPVVLEADPLAAARRLKGLGCTLVATALEGAVPLADAAPKRPVALLMGNEGAGLSSGLLAAADLRVAIPMKNGVDSLNVAAAAAILMYALR
ncbi:RNA methyltransferase [Ruminococcaceae bacterium OttesenSCG-928-A11]|nr:RNA methyltransferase [Ruminococcaceae bacterium OttesenSCG-928-A11]